MVLRRPRLAGWLVLHQPQVPRPEAWVGHLVEWAGHPVEWRQ